MNTTKARGKTMALPEELFHAIAVLATRLSFIAEEECKVSTIELVVLWHVRHYGKVYGDGVVILRQELTRMLKQKFRYTDGDVSKLLAKLQEDHFIVRTAVTAEERLQLFGSQEDIRNDTRVVLLTATADKKLEEFKEHIRMHADNYFQEQNPATRAAFRAFKPVIEKFSRWLMRRYEPSRERTLYLPDTTEE